MQAGHALAAAAEGVAVTGAGASLVLLAPAAFVELDDEDLAMLGRGGMLRVAAAGAWHNLALAAACSVVQAVLPAASGWAGHMRLLLGYTTALSVALALLNMAPAWHLDGEQVLRALLLRPRRGGRELPRHRDEEQQGGGTGQSVASGGGASRRREAAARWVLHGGTALYAATVLLHVAQLW